MWSSSIFQQKKRLLYVTFKLFVSPPLQLWQICLWMEVIDPKNQIPSLVKGQSLNWCVVLAHYALVTLPNKDRLHLMTKSTMICFWTKKKESAQGGNVLPAIKSVHNKAQRSHFDFSLRVVMFCSRIYRWSFTQYQNSTSPLWPTELKELLTSL